MAASLASLEAKRNAKRRQVESLFEQQQAIQKQMEALQEELQALDDEIDAYDDDDDDEYQEERKPAAATQRHSDEELTEPSAASMTFPDELLSDPTTQMTQQQQQYQEYDEHPRTTSNAMMGQLQLSRTSVSKKKHAAPPAGLKRTGESSSQTNTLENYFVNGRSSQQQSSVAAAVVPMNNTNNDNTTTNLSAQIRDLLNNTFCIQAFRGHQEEIIHSTLVGQDVFVIMRTGGGKSLTYQLPALLEGRYSRERKITVVVSPLLSLIQDQEDQLNQYCPNSAISFHSQLSREEQTRRWGLLRDYHSGVCLILVTPEKVHKSNKLRNELEKLHEQGRLGRFVIDEAHCCSNWGHDFRPDYTKLGLLKTHFPTIPLLAVTATASDRVRNDVCSILRLGTDYQFFRSSARRPNLTYSVKPKNGTKLVDDMTDFIQQHHKRDAGIIYTMTRKEADDLANKLSERGIVARSYHSSVSAATKERIHKSWMRNETQVVVATIAFGLGINKPDVRFVLHQTISKSLEAYYQESGRAGRDGGPADCVLYYSPKDVPRLICMIHGDNGEQTFWNMARYAQASGSDAVCKGIILKSMGEPDAPDVEPLMEADPLTELRDVTAHAKTVMTLLQQKILEGHDLTLPMLVKEWRSKKDPADCVKENPPAKEFSEDECMRIIISLIIENVISPNVVWNSYGNTMYLKLGQNGPPFIASPTAKVALRLPVKPPKAAKGTSKKKKASKKAESDEDGWITPNKSKKRKATKPKGATKAKKPKAQKKTEVIELLDESSSEEDEPILNKAGRVSWQSEDVASDSSDSENEF